MSGADYGRWSDWDDSESHYKEIEKVYKEVVARSVVNSVNSAPADPLDKVKAGAPFVESFGPNGGYPLMYLYVGGEIVCMMDNSQLAEYGMKIEEPKK